MLAIAGSMPDRPGRLYHVRDVSKDVLGRFGTFRDVYHFPPANQLFSGQEPTTSNYRLRAALTKAGLLPDDLADAAGVDTKTVQRWLSGRTPHPRHRTRVANALHTDELELWPDATPTTTVEDPTREIAGAYPHGPDPDTPDWRELLDAARDRVELLDFTLDAIVCEPGVVEQLAAKANTA